MSSSSREALLELLELPEDEPLSASDEEDGRELEDELLWPDEELPDEGRLDELDEPEELEELDEPGRLAELLEELEEDAEASSEGSSSSAEEAEALDEADELELPDDAPDEPEELTPLSKETVRVLLTTWLSLYVTTA